MPRQNNQANHPLANSRKAAPFPSKADILKFIEDSPDNVGKREIARAFHIRGDDRARLKALLSEMKAEGLIEGGRRRTLDRPGTLPNVTVIEVVGTDVDGELLGKPASWDRDEPAPAILVVPGRRQAALGIADRVLARMTRLDDGSYEARVMKRLPPARDKVLGIYRKDGRIVPTDRRARQELQVEPGDDAGAEPGELVLAEVLSSRRNKLGLKTARVLERLGDANAPKSTSLVAVHTHGIPTDFDPKAIEEAERARPVELGKRTDLRDIPLVTIDPADARDHDDAVWAEPDGDPENPGGWHVIVAIADVAHYVRSGSALDAEAYKRGNSVYFPDRVVPMLPEALSTDLCSLKAGQDRACMAAHLWFDAEGRKIRHKFVRGLMRTAANLSYEQMQAAQDGEPGDEAGPLLDTVIRPLYGAYQARLKERGKRAPLDLDLPERRIALDEIGRVLYVAEQVRLDAHKLIEEFMIAANVAAAEELERKRTPCMYRVHEAPSAEKMESLREFLDSMGYRLPKAQRLKPQHFNSVLASAEGTPHQHVVNTVVLRSQSQAVYSPANLGHFGLALDRYAHFTSPIRRYADLIVHRALIRALGLGSDGLKGETEDRLDEIGDHISTTERRAMAAERDCVDRYMAAFMADKVGAEFNARISGVSRFGLFVALDETGAEGLIPIRMLGREYFRHEQGSHALVGEETGITYRLGDAVRVRLVEAAPVTGGLRFEILNSAPSRKKGRDPKRGKRRRKKR